jgi:hypothetical protein
MATQYEQLENIERSLKNLVETLNPKKEDENPNDEISGFERRRLIFVVVGMLASAIYSYVMWAWFLPLFSVSFGFFLAFGMLGFAILFDEYILPGSTFLRISKNAIASSITILAFVIIIVSGAQIGNSLITDPYQSEEHRQTVNTEYRQPSTSYPVGSGMRRDTGTSDREQ